MGGILLCSKCDVNWHSHDGTGSYVNDEHYCENCTQEIEAHWLLRSEEE